MNILIICGTIVLIVAIICITYYKTNYIKNNYNSYVLLNTIFKNTNNINDFVYTLDSRINFLRDKIIEIDKKTS